MNMDKLLKQAQKMQAQMSIAKEDLAKTIIEGEAGGGVVKAKVNGNGEVLSISISPEVVNPNDVDMLEDLILSALKEAFSKSKDVADKSMSSITGGMGRNPGWI
ncbi:MAG: YbaB/EbfC family nucleoid-associated protein [Synergistaceae bacterium]|nr:YbaB/EbfC family nucleoid-associated protein [Synergistaceae bacterium]